MTRATAGLGLSNGELEQLCARTQDGLLRLVDGRVAGANAALARLAERSLADLDGLPARELFADSDGAPVERPPGAARLRTPGGALRPVAVEALAPDLFLVVSRVREQQLEQEVWQLTEAARARTPDPEAPLRGELAGALEHELATSLTVALGYLKMLLRGELKPEAWSYAVEARRALQRAADHVRNLVQLATHGALEARHARKPLRLEDALETALAAARPLLDARKQQLRLDVDTLEAGVLGDSDALSQVFVNLLSNAGKFAPHGGEVRLVATSLETEHGEFACVAVEDDGPGVGPADIERIFRPFVQTDPSAEGLGLGLAICREIVAAHGGRIEVIPTGDGGRFRVLIPLAERA